MSIESSLQSLIHSNIQPLSHEYAAAKEYVAIANRNLMEANGRIAELQKQLAEIEERKSEIEGDRDRYADIISARRRIPPEIIASFIKLATLEPDGAEKTWGTSNSPINPYMLVSREWYRVACGFAEFWTHLQLNITWCSREETLGIVTSATKWYERASNLPISLTLSMSAGNPSNAVFVDFLHSLSSRWSSLSIILDVAVATEFDFLVTLFHTSHSTPVVWSALRTFHIDLRSPGRMGSQKAWDSFSNPPDPEGFPSLKDARISWPIEPHLGWCLPWQGLTVLHLGPFFSLDAIACLSILERCTLLERCYIGMACIRRPPNQGAPLPTPTLPHLTSLSMETRSDDENQCAKILAHITTPHLRFLKYTLVDESGFSPSILPSLTRFIRRSQCSNSLAELQLELNRGLNYVSREMEALFQAVPHLTTFKLLGDKIDYNFLQCIPRAVTDLTIEVSYPWIEKSRLAFVKVLYEQWEQPCKATLRIAESEHSRVLRGKMEELGEKLGGRLVWEMD